MENQVAKKMVSNMIEGGIIRNSLNTLDKHTHFVLVKFNNSYSKFKHTIHTYEDTIRSVNYGYATITDVIYMESRSTNTILPIPLINDEFAKENYKIEDLPGLLVIVFINISKSVYPEIGGSLDYLMNLLNNNDIFSNTNIINQIGEGPINSLISNTNITNQIGEGPINSPIGSQNEYRTTLLTQYSDQINTMANMGFNNENKVLESLIVSDGELNGAIHYYLNS